MKINPRRAEESHRAALLAHMPEALGWTAANPECLTLDFRGLQHHGALAGYTILGEVLELLRLLDDDDVLREYRRALAFRRTHGRQAALVSALNRFGASERAVLPWVLNAHDEHCPPERLQAVVSIREDGTCSCELPPIVN
jgi:hypothetical protein